MDSLRRDMKEIANKVVEIFTELGIVSELLGSYTYIDSGDKWLLRVLSGAGDIKIEPSLYRGINICLPLLVVSPDTVLPFLCMKDKISGFLSVRVSDEESAYISYNFPCSVDREGVKEGFLIAKKEMTLLREMSMILASSINGMMEEEEEFGSTEDRLLNMILDSTEEEDSPEEEEL
jgi:hypothetical protein